MYSRILNWMLIIGLALAGFWGFNQYKSRLKYETFIQNQNQKSYYDLVGNFENMATLTSKSLVSTTPQNKAMLFTDVSWQANNAQQNLSDLPLEGQGVRKITKFLTQMGDFSYYLAKKSSKGLPVSDAEITKLQNLHNEIGNLSEDLHKLNDRVGKDGMAFTDLQKVSDTTNKASGNLIGGTFKRLDKQMQSYPSLIYDGPFSDHIYQKKPLGLVGKIFSVAEAKAIALAFIDKKTSKNYTIKNNGITKGKIPAYNMQISNGNKNEIIYLDITRKGGRVVLMLNVRPVTKRVLSTTQATVYAENFLNKNGLTSMVPSYSYRQGNISVLTFAYKDSGIIIYPDLVKLKVALDNGEIVGFEGAGYVMNHRQRSFPKPEFPVDKARAKLPKNINIVSERLTLIPTETLEEKLCYEFRVKLKGDTFLIYLNAVSGYEERILKIIDLPNGQWAM